MAFVNASLLIGTTLIAVPIVLHLILRQRPRQLEFPAVRFLQKRREANRRRFLLRHWALLLLRCLVLLILAMLLARPSVHSSFVTHWILISGIVLMCLLVAVLAVFAALHRRGTVLVGSLTALACSLLVCLLVIVGDIWRADADISLGQQEAPVAATLIIDTAPRMLYQQHDQTRLESAQSTAKWLIDQLPDQSEIFIAEPRQLGFVRAADKSAAKKSIAGLYTTSASQPLPLAIERAIGTPTESDFHRREVYVFTDLAATAWEPASTGRLRDIVSHIEDIQIFVIDVGVAKPHNFALGPVTLSNQNMPRHSSLYIKSDLRHLGPGGQREVELFIESPNVEQPIEVDGELIQPTPRRAQRVICDVQENGKSTLEFQLSPSELGTLHGWLRISGADGLPIDDTRYFTVEIQKATKILVVYGKDADSRIVSQALAPDEFRQSQRARFACDEIPIAELAKQDLTSYAAICLLDPSPLADTVWQQLSDHIRRGGGVGIFLGRNARPIEHFNNTASQTILPASLKPLVMRRPRGDIYLAPQSMDHPILRKFQTINTTIPWHMFPVYRHWVVEDIYPQSQVVASFSNQRPALIERNMGQGKILMMTTPVSDPAFRQDPWNRLVYGESWPFLVLLNEAMSYLVASNSSHLNYKSGETATLSWNSANASDRYLLFTPDGTWENIHDVQGKVTVRFTDLPGIYRIVSEDKKVQRGFSVNYATQDTALDRLTDDRLKEIFGEQPFKLVKSRHEIIREQGEARIGREFYPFLAVLLAIILGLEHVLANRFYGVETMNTIGRAKISSSGKS